jgi:hypothetical protein
MKFEELLDLLQGESLFESALLLAGDVDPPRDPGAALALGGLRPPAPAPARPLLPRAPLREGASAPLRRRQPSPAELELLAKEDVLRLLV